MCRPHKGALLAACGLSRPGADAIKKFTPSLGIPYLGV